jgi:hypothetical protein
VATLSVIGPRVETLDLCCLGDGDACCVVTSLGALSWSLGLLNLMAALVERGTPYHFVSVWPFGLFIRKKESLFREVCSDWAPASRHPGCVLVQGDRRGGLVNNKVIREHAFGQRVRQLDGFRCTAVGNLVENAGGRSLRRAPRHILYTTRCACAAGAPARA